MKTAMSGLLVALLAAAVPALADAGTRDRGVNQRQHHQQQRIHQGWHRERHDAERRFSRHDAHVRFDTRWHHPIHGGEFPQHRPRHAWSGSHDPRQFRAWNGDPRIDRIQQRQHDRIVQGIRSGELTRREAHQLIEEQRAIRAEERAYLADGVLTRVERADLYEDLSDASRHIYNETHDAQTRR